MTSARHRLVVGPDGAGERLDRYLTTRLPELSRTRVQALIEAGEVRIGARAGRASTKVVAGDQIMLAIPAPVATTLEPEPIALRVVYEDADLLVVDKPAGLVVHPAPGHPRGTLVNALLAHCTDLAGIGGDVRPGIVHRLDKDTSGLLVVAKHDRAHRLLAAQFRERTTEKRYLALVDGAPASGSGTIEAPIGRHPQRTQPMAIITNGRPAKTHFRVLRRFLRPDGAPSRWRGSANAIGHAWDTKHRLNHTLLECRPVTGRTHQIRVHLAGIGCPIVGDRVYGRKEPTLPSGRHFLHAAQLSFRLPSGELMTFEAPLPDDLEEVLRRLEHP